MSTGLKIVAVLMSLNVFGGIALLMAPASMAIPASEDSTKVVRINTSSIRATGALQIIVAGAALWGVMARSRTGYLVALASFAAMLLVGFLVGGGKMQVCSAIVELACLGTVYQCRSEFS